MAALESQANYALTDIDYTTPAPAMAAATPSQTQFIVLFDFDSVDYAPGNGTIVREALDAALASAGSALRITGHADRSGRSEEHTSELQSLMRISYAVFCLQKKKPNH